MEMKAVESSNIAAIGYDPDNMRLGVRFKGTAGVRYEYENVTEDEYRALVNSASVGKAFQCLIRLNPKRHPFTKREEG